MDETTTPAKAMEVDEVQIEEKDRNPSSSDSSSSSDSDEEGADETQIHTLESQLKENPWYYDAHVQLIHALRKLGHVEKLRQARESMYEHFPLPPKMWREWTKDEASLNATSEAFTYIEKLYERGVHEYLSVSLWYDYLNFVQEHDQMVTQCASAGVQKMRNLYERALTAAGLHVVEGGMIWESYREYEQAILLTIADDNNEEKSKQIHRIRALFQRQLAVPLADLKSTLVNYKTWEVEQGNTSGTNSELDGVPGNVLSAYQKALELYNARRLYEDQLSRSDASDADRFQAYMSYINFEEASGDPARVQILYERSVSDLPLFSELWLRYTSYLDDTLKVPNIVKDVYSRAVRNCSWVGDLWERYMLALEDMGASEKDLSSVFERSIQGVFTSFEEYLNLFLTRVDGLRRRISFGGIKEDELNYALIRDTFQRAADYFSPEMITTYDLLRLYSYWARLEGTLGGDITAARGVWEGLIKKCGSMLGVWQGYIAMEIGFGHLNEARSIYKRCYSKRLSGSGFEDICHSWLRFEKEYGTIGDFKAAMKKVTPRLQELEMFKTTQESKSAFSFSAKKNNLVSSNVPQKRKITRGARDKQPPTKRQKSATPKHLEVSHADSKIGSDNMHDIGTVNKAEQGIFPGDVETDANTEESARDSKPKEEADANTEQSALDSKPREETDANTEQSARDSKPKESKSNFYTDQCTAYVSNISLEAKEQHLREFFGDSGGVSAIRLLKDKFTGKSRGIAYVDFSDEEHLAAAISKNKQKLLGNKLSIARSDPMQSRKRTSAGSNPSRGRGRGALSRNDTKSSKAGGAERDVKLVGRNTFAVPRAVVKPLGWKVDKGAKADDASTEEPKSNDEFRAMLLKK